MQYRIRALRKALGLSQEELGKQLGLKSRGKIANIELGKIEPDDDFLNLICSTYSVRKEWIQTGEGEMFENAESETAAYVDSLLDEKEDPLYDLIRAIMKTYNDVDETSQDAIKSFAKDLIKNLNRESRG